LAVITQTGETDNGTAGRRAVLAAARALGPLLLVLTPFGISLKIAVA
jgi:hypothetical protein